MSIKYQASKRDKNEVVITEALRYAGAFVTLLYDKGVPDLLVIFRGNTYYIEVKSDGGRLTSAQIEWHAQALNNGVKVHVVKTVHEALVVIGVIDQ